MSNTTLAAIVTSLNAARTTRDYGAAKRLAGRLGPTEQLAVVDALIDAWHRVRGLVAPAMTGSQRCASPGVSA